MKYSILRKKQNINKKIHFREHFSFFNLCNSIHLAHEIYLNCTYISKIELPWILY